MNVSSESVPCSHASKQTLYKRVCHVNKCLESVLVFADIAVTFMLNTFSNMHDFHWLFHYIFLNICMCVCLCAYVCVCVYWPWLAAPAGAPWWLQDSCPAGSAAHTQSEPTSLLCPFLPAAACTPGRQTYVHTDAHTHSHTRTYTMYTFVYVYI